jgi:hypothetical protein
MNADAGLGGLAPQRPDQQRNYPPTGVQPGSSSGIVRARLVIVSGAGVSGVFVYNGTPGTGNPPVLSIVPPGVTTDPYGNTVNAVLEVGNPTGAHLEVDQNGVMYLTNASNSITLLLDPSLTLAEWIPGGLGTQPAVTIAAADGTDPGFFTYPAGIQTNLPVYLPSLFIAEGAAPSVPTGFVGIYADAFGDLHVLQAPLFLDAGFLQLPDEAAPATPTGSVRLYGASGQLDYVSPDGNDYDTGRLSLQIAGQTLNSTGFTALQSTNVAAQAYSFRGWVQYANSVAADPPIFELTGPATSQCNYQFRNNSIAAGTITATAAIKASLSQTFGGGNAVTTGQFLEVWGSVTFSAAGLFDFSAACTVAADTVAITRGEFTIEPVVAT